MSEAVIALLAAIFGGAGLKVIEHMLTRQRSRDDVAKDIRDELRTDVKDLKDEANQLRQDRDKIRSDLYDLQHVFAEKKYLLALAIQHINQLVDEATDNVDGIEVATLERANDFLDDNQEHR